LGITQSFMRQEILVIGHEETAAWGQSSSMRRWWCSGLSGEIRGLVRITNRDAGGVERAHAIRFRRK
jgi:hypothetical protein